MKTLKTLLVTIAVLFCSTTVSAHDFEVDGIYYNITSESEMTVEVTYKASAVYRGDVVIPENVVYNGSNYEVTGIGYGAFYECAGLTNITIPNSVTSIGASAFSGCSNLTNIAIPNSVTNIGSCAFWNCSSLTDITISNSVTNIDECVFGLCTGLTNITIPNSVTSIGTGAFISCSSLTDITIPNSVTNIRNTAFEECTSLPAENYIRYADTWAVGVTDKTRGRYTLRENTRGLAGGTFSDCTSFKSLVLPEGVISIGEYAFNNCTNLSNINIPSGVSYIGEYAFYKCALTEVSIPKGITEIMNYSFHSNYFSTVEIPEGVTSIGNNAFSYCSKLESVNLPQSLTHIKENAFSYCYALPSIIIPESVTSIGSSAFTKLKSVTLNSPTILSEGGFADKFGSNVTEYIIGADAEEIKDYAFYNSTALQSITLPETLTTIGEGAFEGCVSLESITIPANVTEIKDYAFSNCSMLSNFIMKSSTPISVSTMSGFNSSATLTVPNGSAKAYSNMGGFRGQFASIKEEVSVNISEANKWSTCALAFDTELPEGVRAFASKGMDENYVLLEEVTTLAANTPYILYAKEGYEGTLTGAVDVANYQETVTDGVLSGAIVEQEVSSGYVLQNQGYGMKFYNMNGQTFTIPAGKCWLSAFDVSGASMMMRFVGGANDIEGVFVDRPAVEDDAIYDLEGRRVETPQRGHIYIIGGQKVLKR